MDITKMIEEISDAIDSNTWEGVDSDQHSHQEDAYFAGVFDAWEAAKDYLLKLDRG